MPAGGQALGEIVFRGNITMKGYLKDPDATQQAFSGGWFHSGDLAVLEPGGYVKIKDRAKDVIISGGMTSRRRQAASRSQSIRRHARPKTGTTLGD